MTTSFTRFLCSTVLAVVMLASCSRPVAYFQRGPVQPASRLGGQTVVLDNPGQQLANASPEVAQTSTTAGPADAYAWQHNELPATKSLGSRMNRIERLLVSTAGTQRLAEIKSSRHLTGMERLVLRKLNKQITHQLAPNHPQKPMIKKGKLLISILVLIAGVLLLTLSTGPLIFIGIVVALFGALGTIVSLIGIDSY